MKNVVHSRVQIMYSNSQDTQGTEYRFIPILREGSFESVADRTASALSNYVDLSLVKLVYLIETPSGKPKRELIFKA